MRPNTMNGVNMYMYRLHLEQEKVNVFVFTIYLILSMFSTDNWSYKKWLNSDKQTQDLDGFLFHNISISQFQPKTPFS